MEKYVSFLIMEILVTLSIIVDPSLSPQSQPKLTKFFAFLEISDHLDHQDGLLCEDTL